MIILMAAVAAGASCPAPLGTDQWIGSQIKAYSRRSIEIVALAAHGDERRLALLIEPNSKFSLGSGDVRLPLGTGLKGARAMGEALTPGSYVYSGWDYIPERRDVCGPHEVDVEFVSSDGSRLADVKFQYDGGKLKEAAGWWRSRFSGPVGEKTR